MGDLKEIEGKVNEVTLKRARHVIGENERTEQ